MKIETREQFLLTLSWIRRFEATIIETESVPEATGILKKAYVDGLRSMAADLREQVEEYAKEYDEPFGLGSVLKVEGAEDYGLPPDASQRRM